jgi:PAS domain S-box-containing protein
LSAGSSEYQSGDTPLVSSAWDDRSRQLLEASFDYRVDTNDRFTHAAPSVIRLLGIEPQQVCGKPFHEVFERQSGDHCSFLQGHNPNPNPSGVTISLARAASTCGEEKYFELREAACRDKSTGIAGRNGVAIDVTLHVTTIQKLQESERKYRRLIEELGEDYVIYTHLPNGELTYVSPSVQRLLGYRVEDLVGRNWRDVIGENFVGSAVGEKIRSEVAAGVRFHKYTVELPDAQGNARLLEIQHRPIFSPDGRYTSMEGIAKDVTEFHRNAVELKKLKDDLEERVAQRTAELMAINERLVESESRYRNVVEDQTEFICRWLPGGRYTFVNEAYCRYMKKPYGELIGQSFYPFIAEEDRPRVMSELASLTPQNPAITTEHRVVRPDRTLAWNQWTNRAIFDDNDVCRGYQSVGRDITEFKVVEDLVLEREEHLKRMSRLAIVGELIAGIAHEIHQPLHAAQLFAEAARRNLEMGTPGGVATAIDCTREISNAVNRTATIIRHLRSFSTTKPAKPEPLDLNEVVHEVADVMSYETRRAGVKLSFDLAEELTPWNGDRVQVQQILVHLLGNAYDAKPQPRAHVWQVTIKTIADAEGISVEIVDNGVGTELEDVDRLFDPFYTTKPEGLGMGLSICKTIAESMRAEVFARKNPDGGMTFTLRLPLANRYEL